MSLERLAGLILLTSLLTFFFCSPSLSEVPLLINYQGKLTDAEGTLLNGSYTVMFSLYESEASAQSIWSENQTVTTNNGIFSVLLGSNVSFYDSTFDREYLYLQISIRQDGNEWEVMWPRQRISSVPFALKAQDSNTLEHQTLNNLDTRYIQNQMGVVTSAMIADGAIGTSQLAFDAVRGDQIAGNSVNSTHIVNESIGGLDIMSGAITSEELRASSVGSSEIMSNSVTANDLQTGAVLEDLLVEDGLGSLLDADFLDDLDSSDFARNVHEHNSLNVLNGDPTRPSLWVNTNGYVGIGSGAPGYKLEVLGYGGAAGGSFRDGFLALKNHNHDAGIRFFNGADDASLKHSIFNHYFDGDILRLTPDGNYLAGIGIEQSGNVSIIGASDNNGSEATLRIHSEYSGGQTMLLDGNEIDAIDSALFLNHNSKRDVYVPVLVIEGGSDLSEHFDINSYQEQVLPEPGMLVSIDSQNPGNLQISHHEYDNKVAGIISGAGGVKSGMLMGQRNSIADGAYPVALTGRVYCNADASNGDIDPGDLLTTSNTPGYAMKVQDYSKAQGAIIGKAMTPLTEGKGLVLVLVSLQ